MGVGPKGEETQVDTVQTQVDSQNTWAEFRPEFRGLASCLVSTCHMLHVLTALFPAVSTHGISHPLDHAFGASWLCSWQWNMAGLTALVTRVPVCTLHTGPGPELQLS